MYLSELSQALQIPLRLPSVRDIANLVVEISKDETNRAVGNIKDTIWEGIWAYPSISLSGRKLYLGHDDKFSEVKFARNLMGG